MNEQELKIKEFRTVEAKKKNLLGLHGKFGHILSALGQPIVHHADMGGLFSQTFLDDYDTDYKDSLNLKPGTPMEIMKQIPTADSDYMQPPEGWEWQCDLDIDTFSEQAIGWHFDGLNRGMHLEITYKNSDKNLIVTYKGYVVYKEHSGDLRAYVPSEKWEVLIEKLYKLSVRVLKERGKLKLVQSNKLSQAKRSAWLGKLWNRWGFK